MTDLTLALITVATWLTPLPTHAQGWLVNYGSQNVVEAVAAYRGYDLAPYPERCGVSAMSPADLGQLAWLRLPDGEWYGPCLVMDVAAREHFEQYVRNGEVLEIPRWLAERLGFTHGALGESFIGACPPVPESAPEWYLPTWRYDPRPTITPSMYPYPAPQLPVDCGSFTP